MRLVERFTTSIDSVPPSDYLTLGAALTEEEERSPYSSYYRRGPAPIPAEQAEALAPGRRLEPSRAFPPEEMARHMLVPHVDIRLSGCCVLPDGTAFGAAWCDMSAVTQEMEDFFDAHWNPGGDLFYKIWYPGAHVRHYADAAIESLGREPEILRVGPAPSLRSMGFPENLTAADPDFLGVRGGNAQLMKLTDREGREKLDITLLHFYRRQGAGKFICTRFWMGLHLDLETGRPVRTLPFYAAVREEAARLLCVHCAAEYATNARNMKDFWAEHQELGGGVR